MRPQHPIILVSGTKRSRYNRGALSGRAIATRLFFDLVTAVIAINLDFLTARLIPGNPVQAILAKMPGQPTRAAIRALELQLGVQTKASLWAQYTHYWNNVLDGNLGVSVRNGFAPVSTLICGALPYTAGLIGGKEVVQVYLAEPGTPASRGRPVRTLAALAVNRAAPGEVAQARLTIPARSFARYDESLASWITPGGEFTVHVGRSSRDLRLEALVRLSS